MATEALDFSIIIHGGAGVIAETDEVAGEYLDTLKEIIVSVYKWAKEDPTRTAVDITSHAVTLLENNPKFNAGLGSVFTADETHELEASLMDGCNLKCGAASLLTNVKNPIKLARVMLDNPFHIWCAGKAAEALAAQKGLEIVDSNSYFSLPHRKAQLEMARELRRVVNDHDKAVSGGIRITRAASEHDVELGRHVLLNGFMVPTQSTGDSDTDDFKTETVGCVAMRAGHVSAATSTGGMTNKMSGRVGDTPIIGSGTYADDRYCAVSATGKGMCRVLHDGLDLHEYHTYDVLHSYCEDN